MEELIQERASVIYYKNKANWMEYGEKCTKLFFNFQYRMHDSPNYIVKEEVKYFNMFLFQSPPSPLTEANGMAFVNNNNVKLTFVQKDSCEGQITDEELLDAIKAF